MEIENLSNSIIFSKPLPLSFIKDFFSTDSENFNYDGVNVFVDKDERNENFVKSLTFSSLNSDKSQILHDRYLRWLSLKVRLNEVIWAYQINAEIKAKTKELIKTPSVLPLVGNVMLTGLIIANTKNLNMNQRRFCIVQIDTTVKIIKRDENYFSISRIINDLKELLKVLEESFKL
ncbi:hypothetical protein D1867_07340 [Acidianus infernus]|uniref:Uncharacterized protein n=1 Tax=Acidianus infernus TaxID=12915 RepID=A0A6A9QGW5_ACIIN|nr:hypothetical protein [Acidianus infernus]MUM65053.1 hypothetical protein [Acidianus infernus]